MYLPDSSVERPGGDELDQVGGRLGAGPEVVFVPLVGERGGGHVGLDGAGRDRKDLHTGGPGLRGESLGEPDDRGLARHVGGIDHTGEVGADSKEGCVRGDVDDAAGAPSHHAGHDGPTAEERPEEVHLDHSPPFRVVELPGHAAPSRDACVVDEQVDRAELGLDAGDCLADGRRVGHVERDGQRAGLLLQLLQLLDRTCSGGNRESRRRELRCDHAADALARTCDQGNAARCAHREDATGPGASPRRLRRVRAGRAEPC